jgi:hypothetical protein
MHGTEGVVLVKPKPHEWHINEVALLSSLLVGFSASPAGVKDRGDQLVYILQDWCECRLGNLVRTSLPNLQNGP